MKPCEIDAHEAVWTRALNAMLEQVIATYRQDRRRAGGTEAEIKAAVAEFDRIRPAYFEEKRREIRPLIVCAKYGLTGEQR